MKNIQIIDAALNCSYDIFEVSNEQYRVIFPTSNDIAFIEDVIAKLGEESADILFYNIWKLKPQKKECVNGIHGTLFIDLLYKKKYYPNNKQSDLINCKII